MEPLVFVIILNYRSYDDALACIRSVRESRYQNIKCLVLDNASPDQSGLRLKSRLPAQEFIQLSQNRGYAGGNNFAIQTAMAQGASYVLILNPDVRLHPDAVKYAVEIMQNDPQIGALNSIQLNADQKTIDSHFLEGVLRPLGYTGLKIQDNDFPDIFEADTLFGAALMLPIKTLEAAGGFDPLFFAYGEESDLCRRIKLHGLKLAVTSNAPVLHLRTAANESDFILFLKLKGYCLFVLKDPKVCFLKSTLSVFSKLFKALCGMRIHEYPFSHYPFKRSHILKTIIWLSMRLFIILKHRQGDIKGRMYL